MRAAARLLLIEGDAIRPILDGAAPSELGLPTVCDGWSVRDVVAHCSAALAMTASGDLHGFSPAENQADVDERKPWDISDLLAELYDGSAKAAVAIDAADGRFDGVGLGEWIHGGDIREPLGADDPYESPGVDLAVELLIERSRIRGGAGVEVTIGGDTMGFGNGEVRGAVETDRATFVRLCGGRRPDPARYRLDGVEAAALVLFD